MKGAGNCSVNTTAATIQSVNENPRNDSFRCVDKAINAIPRIQSNEAQEESENIRPSRIIEIPEMDSILKLFFISIDFAVFMWTEAGHF